MLAGGRGTRLGDRLQGLPKPMVPVGKKPFLELVLTRLAEAGCNRAILSIGYRYDLIQQYFGKRFCGMEIDYAIEERPLGTGGAIRLALRSVHEASAIVLNGDTLLEVDYGNLLQSHTESDAVLTLAGIKQDDTSRFGSLIIEAGRIISICEKGQGGPGWINGGVYVLKTNIQWPPELPDKFSFETDFLMKRAAILKPRVFTCCGYFLDIGVPEDLDRAQHELAS